jgi:GT2 family glycosyltransferase
MGEHPDIEQVLSANAENKGIAIGRNQALKIADESFPDTKWLCTLDNDVEMPEGWLTECIQIIEANPAFGMIGVNMEGKPYQIITSNGKTFQNKPAGNLGTACIVFPKSVHKMLGFFNTEYGKYGEEDADWGMRARVVGYKLGYIEKMGTHFGEGENDVGEYREYKTACHKKNLAKFNANCGAYARREKAIYIAYKE